MGILGRGADGSPFHHRDPPRVEEGPRERQQLRRGARAVMTLSARPRRAVCRATRARGGGGTCRSPALKFRPSLATLMPAEIARTSPAAASPGRAPADCAARHRRWTKVPSKSGSASVVGCLLVAGSHLHRLGAADVADAAHDLPAPIGSNPDYSITYSNKRVTRGPPRRDGPDRWRPRPPSLSTARKGRGWCARCPRARWGPVFRRAHAPSGQHPTVRLQKRRRRARVRQKL